MKTTTSHVLTSIAAAALLLAGVSGCSQSGAEASSSPKGPPIDASHYLLTEEPNDAVGVIAARGDVQDGDDIVLVARIGGSKQPWFDGRAAFMAIDASMLVAAGAEECSEGAVCMDDCCAALRAECTTLVKIVDEQGKILPLDAREILKAEVNDMVVVRGRVQRDKDEGTFVVLADGVYVRR